MVTWLGVTCFTDFHIYYIYTCSHIGIVQVVNTYIYVIAISTVLLLAMPFNMILIMYVIPCEVSCDFSNITILHIHVQIL